MAMTGFVCPDGQAVAVTSCIAQCRQKARCMMLPTLRAIAEADNRDLEGFSITELVAGTREQYLKKTMPYAVDPQSRVFALHGSAMHALNEKYAEGILSEIRLQGADASGMFDAYGDLLGTGERVLGEYKITSSYKAMRALGCVPVSVETGEVFKSGPRKGQIKKRNEWREGGPKNILEWSIQLNYYRMLLEEAGFGVDRMVIQLLVRDFGLQIAASRNIDRPVLLIEVNRISNHWLKQYVAAKSKRLAECLKQKQLPPVCSARERWGDRKCGGYCDVACFCEHGLHVANRREVA